MAGSSALNFDMSEVIKGLDDFGARIERGVFAAVEYQRSPAENYMRVNARWTDRTTNARNGLVAMTNHRPGHSHELVLAHTMPYGIWLEVRFAGRYAIIEKSVQSQGDAIMKNITGLFGRI